MSSHAKCYDLLDHWSIHIIQLVYKGIGSVATTDIHQRSPRPPILPHVMASSAMGAQFGGLWVLLTMHAKHKCKTNVSMILMHHAAFLTRHAGFYACFVVMLRQQ